MDDSAKVRSSSHAHPRASNRRVGWARRVLMLVVLLPLLVGGLPAFGSSEADDEYDPTDAGNPLRIAAYVLHPVGVILDTLIFRPAHWLGSKEPIKTLVGRDD